MRFLVEPIRSPARLRLAVFVSLSLLSAGCSSESSRFGDSPFSNPFASRNSGPQGGSDVTGSISSRPSGSRIESQPLPPQTGSLPPPPRANSLASTGVSSGAGGMSSYKPSAAPADVTGSVSVPQSPPPVVAHVPPPAPSNQGNWNWDGGTAITVGPNETIDIIANRYGVPSAAIAQANGMAVTTPIHSGQRLVIPRYNYSGAQVATSGAPATRAPAPQRPAPAAPRTTASASSTVHIVGPGETLTKISRQYGKSVVEVANANNIPPYKMVQMGERIVIPGVRNSTPVASAAPAPAPRYAAAMPSNSARMVQPAQEKPETAEPPASAAEPMGSTPGFRWPVRGRIITGFGPKPTGQQNDGINLAVPEGTAIKAADDGVVAYAGNELKGYGNLVLVRHPNGYVTAYAHASELMVKRGDQIKRGQVIAKSGQTGNVTSPQLHFEIRKGATPVDPMQFLTGAT